MSQTTLTVAFERRAELGEEPFQMRVGLAEYETGRGIVDVQEFDHVGLFVDVVRALDLSLFDKLLIIVPYSYDAAVGATIALVALAFEGDDPVPVSIVGLHPDGFPRQLNAQGTRSLAKARGLGRAALDAELGLLYHVMFNEPPF